MANKTRTQPGVRKVKPETNPFDNLQVIYEKNKKTINNTVTVILIIIIAVFAYFKMYEAPREDKALTALSYPQRYFQADSLDMALNGDGQHNGFLKIEKKYSGTKAANLCHYYAGICYLNKSDYNGAIKQLKDFNGKGTLLEYAAYGAIGDAYMEMGKIKDGIEYYGKAVTNKDDQLLTPTYLYREGVAYEINNQPNEAINAYKRIRDEYPQSMEARDIQKALAHLGVIE